MRKKFIQCKSYKTAKRRCPWASRIAKVIGGFMCFESITDYEIWRNQKGKAGEDTTAETKYFRLKWFKNHNLHIEFKGMDLADKLN